MSRKLKARAMKSVERLALRLEREHQILADVSTFSRTRAGYWQRSAGAWSWTMRLHDRLEIGSQYPVKELLKADKLSIGMSFGAYEVDPA